MSDIDRFRLSMIVGIIMSCGLGLPFLIPTWIFGEIVYARVKK